MTKDRPKIIAEYESVDHPGVMVVVYEPEEEWPPLRILFYTATCHASRSGTKPASHYEDSPSESEAKHIRSGEGESTRCGMAQELGGTFVNDPYYHQKR